MRLLFSGAEVEQILGERAEPRRREPRAALGHVPHKLYKVLKYKYNGYSLGI